MRLYRKAITAGSSEVLLDDASISVIENNGTETKYTLQLPKHSAVEFLDPWTVAYIEGDQLRAMDIRSPNARGSFAIARNDYTLTPIPNSKRLIVGPFYAATAGERTRMLDLSDLTNIKEITSWPSGNGFALSNECIFQARLDQSAIDRRSLIDGSDLGPLQLAPHVQAAFDPSSGDEIELVRDWFVIISNGENRYFERDSQRPLDLNRTDLVAVRSELSLDPIVIFYATETAPRNVVGYDTAAHRVLWEVSASSDYTIVGTAKPDKFILGTDQHGMSVDVIDARTGKKLASYAPFRHFSWAVPMLAVGLGAWIIAWLKSTAAKRIPSWLNVAALSIMALLFFNAHQLATGTSSQLLVSQSYSVGVLLGLATASATWLVLGRSRFGTRYLPLAAMIVAAISYTRWSFPGYEYASTGIISILMQHLSAAAIVFGLLRLTGLRLPGREETAKSDDEPTAPWTLRDLFILAAAAAVLIAAARPIFVFGLPDIDAPRVIALALFAIGSASMLAVGANQRLLVAWACTIAGALYAALIFESLYHFVTGRELFVGPVGVIQQWFRNSATGIVTSFLVFLAMVSSSKGEAKPMTR